MLERRRFEQRARRARLGGLVSAVPALKEIAEPLSPPALLRQRPYRQLSLLAFFSRIAQNALNLGLVLLVLDATGKAFFTSLLVLALVLPMMIAGIVAGVAADAIPRRLIVALGNVAPRGRLRGFHRRGWGRSLSLRRRCPVGALRPVCRNGRGGHPAPAIVTRGELARANAIGQAVGGAAQIAGFAVLTPVVLRVFERADVLFGIAAGLFLIAAVEAVRIGPVARTRKEPGEPPSTEPEPDPGAAVVGDEAVAVPPSSDGGSWWQAGWRAMRRDPAVFKAAVELTLITMMLIIMGGLIPTYIRDVLELPFEIGALVLTPAAIGVILGLRVAGPLAHRLPHGLLSSVGFAGFTGLLLALAFVNEEASFLGGYGAFAWLNDVNLGNFDGGALLAMALVLPLGFAYAIVSVAAQTVVNERVPLTLQGRVVATQGAMAALAASLPVLGAGALGDWLGCSPLWRFWPSVSPPPPSSTCAREPGAPCRPSSRPPIIEPIQPDASGFGGGTCVR